MYVRTWCTAAAVQMTSKYGVYGFRYRCTDMHASRLPGSVGWTKKHSLVIGDIIGISVAGECTVRKHLSSSPFRRYSSFLNTTHMLFSVQIHLVIYFIYLGSIPYSSIIALLPIVLLSIAILLYSLLLHLYSSPMETCSTRIPPTYFSAWDLQRWKEGRYV